MLITGDMIIGVVIGRHPGTAEVFRRRGMECLACLGAAAESIENGALMHGHDPEELLRELNRVVSGKSR